MSRLARWVALVIALGAPSAAFAQTSLSNGYCDLGAAEGACVRAAIDQLPAEHHSVLHGDPSICTERRTTSDDLRGLFEAPRSPNPFTATSAGFTDSSGPANSATYDVMGSGSTRL